MNPFSINIGPFSLSAFSRLGIACRYAFLGALINFACLVMPAGAEKPGISSINTIESRLQRRVNDNPRDASAWRLLGRLRLQHDELEAAYVALARAIELAPDSAAAQYDYGCILVLMEMPILGEQHLRKVVKLAPESRYATEAVELLNRISDSSPDIPVQTTGFEVKRFDGSDLSKALEEAERIEQELTPSSTRSPFDFQLEAGLLYNSNVALTPLSRELSPAEPESFQFFASPNLEYRIVNGSEWRAGPTFNGYFNLNESNHKNLNLRNYTPGLFVERRIDGDRAIHLTRIQFDYTHEEFDGNTFGNRNAVTLSNTAYWDRRNVSYFYWSADFTDFTSDGVLPTITSRDGWTNTVGLSHAFYPECWYLYKFRLGADLQFADAEGSDFSYHGVNLYTEANIPLTQTVSLILELGWGYRDYFDFEFTPSRNENIWRGSLELEKELNDSLTAAAVFNYDRFDSENVLFEADRFVTGVVLRYEF